MYVRNPYCYRFYQFEYKRDSSSDKREEYKIDKDEVDFCLNCTKENCNGNCKEYKEYMRNKNGKR